MTRRRPGFIPPARVRRLERRAKQRAEQKGEVVPATGPARRDPSASSVESPLSPGSVAAQREQQSPDSPPQEEAINGGDEEGMSKVMHHQQQSPSSPTSTVVRSSNPMQDNQGSSSTMQDNQGSSSPMEDNQGYSPGHVSQSGNHPPVDNQEHNSRQDQSVAPSPSLPPVPILRPLHIVLGIEAPTPDVVALAPQPPVQMSRCPSGARDADENAMDTTLVGASSEASDGGAKQQLGLKVFSRWQENPQLHKELQPKDAVTVLDELVAGANYNVCHHLEGFSQPMVEAIIEIDGNVYSGLALSLPLAKQKTAENALKAIIMEKICKFLVKMEQQVASDDGGKGEDDVPWKSITSFAVYKLFHEWQMEDDWHESTSVPASDGRPVPVGDNMPTLSEHAVSVTNGMPTPVSGGTPIPVINNMSTLSGDTTQHSGKKHFCKPMKRVPENLSQLRPNDVLAHIWPDQSYVEVSRFGKSTNTVVTVQTTIDGKSYSGVGRNKNEAEKEAAKAALAGAFDIHYP